MATSPISASSKSVLDKLKIYDFEPANPKKNKKSAGNKKRKWHEIWRILLGFPKYTIWNVTILVTVVVNYILATTNLVYTPESVLAYLPFYAAFDILYFTNFILLLLHNYGKRTKKELNRTIKTSVFVLVLDVFSILSQFALVVPFIESRYIFLVHYFRTATFLRLHHIFIRSRTLEVKRLSRLVIQYFLLLLIFIHTANLIWYFIECMDVDCVPKIYRGDMGRVTHRDWKYWYFFHIHTTVQLLLNVGFGNIFPGNFYEVYLFIAIIILGHGMIVWLVSKFTWYFINRNNHKVFFIQKIKQISKYVEEIDADTSIKTVEYYRALWKHQKGITQPSLLNVLPPTLRYDVFHDVNSGLLYRSVLLRDLPEFVLRKIAQSIKNVFLPPGEKIYTQRVVKTCMVFVENGVLEVLSDQDEESRVIAFAHGTVLGESALFFNIPSKASVRAVVYTELRVLEKRDFLIVMMSFSDAIRNLKFRLEERMSHVNTNPAKYYGAPNLRRLKLKLRGKVGYLLGTSPEDEYCELYSISQSVAVLKKRKRFPLMKIWTIFYDITQIIFCLWYSYNAVFQRPNTYYLKEYGFVADILCFVDILLQINASRIVHEYFMSSLVKTVNYKMKDWRFNLDIYSLFPMELWANFIEHPVQRNRFYDLFRLNRLLRLYRISELIGFFESETHGRWIACVWKILVYSSLFYYCAACIIYLRACLYEVCDNTSWYQMRPLRNGTAYSTDSSFYFAVLMSLTTGLSGFFQKSYSENFIPIFIVLLAVFLQKYFLGLVISSLFLENFHEKQLKLKYYLRCFSSFYRMSSSSYLKIKNIFRINPYFYEDISRRFIKETAPYSLVTLIQTNRIKNTLADIPLFQLADGYFLTFLEKQGKISKLPINETLYSHGDFSRRMYVIQEGYCNVYDSGYSWEQTVGPGTPLGVLEMLFCLPKKHTVVTSTDCVVILLDYALIQRILGLFPKEKHTIEEVLRDDSLSAEVKKLQTSEETGDRYDIEDRYVPEQPCFIGLSKNWPNYCEVYRRKLGVFWICAVVLMPAAIHPEGFFLVFWCATRSILIVCWGIMEPISLLSPQMADDLYWWEVFCHSSLYLDMYLLMHVAYYDGKGFLKIHPAQTFWYYIRHGFLLDLLAALPWELLINPIDSRNPNITDNFPYFHMLWRLPKLIQFYKVFRCLGFFGETVFGTVKVIRMFKLSLALLLIIHISTSLGIRYICQQRFGSLDETKGLDLDGNGYLRCYNSSWRGNSIFDRFQEPYAKYLLGIYTVVNFMTLTGVDVVSTVSESTLIGVTILIFVGFVAFVVFTATVSSMMLEDVAKKTDCGKDVSKLLSIFEAKGLAKDMRRKSFRHYEYIWDRNGGSLHQPIQDLDLDVGVGNILKYFYRNILRDVPLFYNIDGNFLGVLVEQISVQQFEKGELILRPNDVLSDIYIVAKGEVDILSKDNAFLHTLGHTGVFGNISLAFHTLSEVYVVARRNVELWVLNTEKLLGTVELYPAVNNKLEKTMKNEVKFMPPKVSRIPDMSVELEDDADTIPRKSSTVFIKYKPIQFCIPPRWFKFSLGYDHGLFKMIDAVTTIASFLNITIIPYIFATQEDGLLIYLLLILEPIFYLRIFFKLHRSYVNVYGNLILSNKKLCKRYLNDPSQLFWDVVPNFPIGVMCFVFPREEWFFSYSCLRLIHLLRIYYIRQYFEEYDSELRRITRLLLLKLLLYYIYIVHILACVWFMLACPFNRCNSESWISRFESDIRTESVFYRMTLSYYYVLIVLTTVGIGDIPSANVLELVFTTITMLIGKVMLAVLIGTVLRCFHHSENNFVEFVNESQLCMQYLERQHVLASQRRRTSMYLMNLWAYGKGPEPAKLLQYLQNPMKQDIISFIYGSQLQMTFLFKDIDDSLLRQILTKLERKLYFRNDYIVKEGDVDSTMYFIYSGDVNVLTKRSYLSEMAHVTLHHGDLFGVSQGLNLEEHHTFFYRASSAEVEILTLKFDDWSYLLQLFPKEREKIFSRVEREYLK
ncbi:hypothetical protein JTB14_030798 [Gonioctena quinquepunctata]|nr:hypothetical protein JTB14_030798 [Gonioctena quinquepunctata]